MRKLIHIDVMDGEEVSAEYYGLFQRVDPIEVTVVKAGGRGTTTQIGLRYWFIKEVPDGH